MASDDWNERRMELILKKYYGGGLRIQEEGELVDLQERADDSFPPLDPARLARIRQMHAQIAGDVWRELDG